MKRKYRLFALLIVICTAFCGCPSNTVRYDEVSTYIGHDYTVVYETPVWSENDNFDLGMDSSDTSGYSDSCYRVGSVQQVISAVKTENYGWFALCLSDEEDKDPLFVATVDEKTLRIRDRISNLPENIIGIGRIVDEPDSFFVYNWDHLFLYDALTSTYKTVLEWDSVNISGNTVSAIYGSDGYIYLRVRGLKGDETVLLRPESPSTDNNAANNKILIIATVAMNEQLRMAVNEYNKNPVAEYRVEIVDYSKQADNLDDAKNKLLISAVSANPPDIINLSGIDESFGYLADREIISDITPFISDSDSISIDNYYDKALELFKKNDKLYAIPYSYEIRTLAVNSEDIDKLGWSVSDMMHYYNQNTDAALYYLNQKSEILSLCLMGNVDFFIDKKRHKSCFDRSEFREILEFCNKFPQESTFEHLAGSSYKEDLSARRLLTRLVVIDHLDMIQQVSYEFDGNVNYVGFPALEEKTVSYINTSPNGGALSICEASKRKDVAWEFLAYFLNTSPYRFNEYDTIWGIPSDERMLQSIINEYRDENSVYANTIVNDRKRHAITDEEVEWFDQLRDHASPWPYEWYYVYRILEEESGAYFAGQKSVDEVIDIIQSRVQLYLDENL